ncbi:flippase [Candidatus Brocadia sinica]|uniref:flippase n=1 Tax=Candidatus Brocadia sinica TaxID=795830 RepID=UPI0012FEEFA1|nr:flippase [Candidatus Brocadia sinica]NOG43139.1 flippase [Planctomycetota bacterium]
MKKVAKGAGISFIGSVTGRCLFFALQVIIARFFSTEVFGLFTLGLTVTRIAELIARLGLHMGTMRFVSIYRKDDVGKLKGILISAPLISFSNGILIGGLIYFFAGTIAESIFYKPALTNVIKNFALAVPFMSSMTIIAMASQGFHTARFSVYIKDIIQPSANIVFVILFIKLGYAVSGIVFAFTLSYVTAVLAGFFFITRQFPIIKKRDIKPVYEIRKLLSYSTPLLFNGFLAFLILWTNTLMLGYMKTPREVGVYRAASQVPIFLTLILTAFNSIYAPAIADMYHRGQMGRLGKIFKTTTRWVFLLTLPFTLILIFSAGEILTIFGRDYIKEGIPVLRIIAIAQFINCATGGVAFTLTMTGKQKTDMINNMVMVVVNVALNYFLIPKYGCLGAAIATGISIGTVNFSRLWEVYFIYKIQPYNMSYMPGIACGTIGIIILYTLDKYFLVEEYLLINNYLLNHATLIKLVSNGLVVCIIFVVGFIIKGFREEDRFVLDAITKKFKSNIFKLKVE